MGWERRRDGNSYYYLWRWTGITSQKIYFGRGLIAEFAEEQHKTRMARKSVARARWEREREELEELVDQIVQFDEAIEVLSRASLIASGYHQHARSTWRRRRAQTQCE